MPFTTTRTSNINYILDFLKQKYPEYIQTIYSFNFDFNDKAKKLAVEESEEFTVSLSHTEIEKYQAIRDQESTASLLALVNKFRLFNISKMTKSIKNRKHFEKLMKNCLNKQLFVYKTYSFNKGVIIDTGDLCFHSSNYNNVKKALDITKIKIIIGVHRDIILKGLKNFGIHSTDFNDIDDPKLDYILHLITDNLKNEVGAQDLSDVLNFQSLRDCVKKADTNLDPSKIHSNEIIKIIKENSPCAYFDITTHNLNISTNVIEKWIDPAILKKEGIILAENNRNDKYFVYAPKILSQFEETFNFIRNDPEQFAALSVNQKELIDTKITVLYSAGRKALSNPDSLSILKTDRETVAALNGLLDEFDAYHKEKSFRHEVSSKDVSRPKKSVIKAILSGIFSVFGLFKSRGDDDIDDEQPEISGVSAVKKPLSRESKDVYLKMKSRKDPILALSEFMEVTKENDTALDKIINDLRNHNLKVVIPIYNARQALYPKRSSKLLLPDIEYLVVPYSVINSSEAITAYIDSLLGYKLKEDVIPGNTLMLIEKYLKNMFYHSRKKAMRKN